MMTSEFMPTSFSDFTAEDWAVQNARAEEWERQELVRKKRERLERTRIPKRFLNASLDGCKKEILDWGASIEAGGFDNLVLIGEVGQGKTYAACAVLLRLMQTRSVAFATFDDVLNEIKATYGGQGSEADVIYRYGNVGVLCIDDFGKARTTDWSLPVLFNLVNHRHANMLPTIFTTQYDGKGLIKRLSLDGDAECAKAILSRMGDGIQVRFGGKDRRLA